MNSQPFSPATLGKPQQKQSRLRSLFPRRLTLSTVFTFLLGGLAAWIFFTPGDFRDRQLGLGSGPPPGVPEPAGGPAPPAVNTGTKKHQSAEEEIETVVFHRARSHGAPTPFEIYIHDPDQDEFTSGEIAERGTWHRDMCDLLTEAIDDARKTKKRGETINILDVGANVGYITMWVAGKGEDVRVTSVEVILVPIRDRDEGPHDVPQLQPHPFHNSLLEKTLNLPVNANLSRRIMLHKVALSTDSEAGTTLCMKVHPSNAAMTFVDKAMDTTENSNLPCTHVPVTTIDRILDGGRKRIDIMKIDVEGYEYNVFAGGKNSLLKYPPKLIVMEYNYFILKTLYNKPPVEWLVNMYKAGYRTVIDMANNKKMTSEADLRKYFEEANFLKAIPSSHTDLILKFS
ncbi:S-adenosyl-L-methionine-dependent methyltransferase, partial [Hyaloraphidium curvatum]